jgi:hypothetical protein
MTLYNRQPLQQISLSSTDRDERMPVKNVFSTPQHEYVPSERDRDSSFNVFSTRNHYSVRFGTVGPVALAQIE